MKKRNIFAGVAAVAMVAGMVSALSGAVSAAGVQYSTNMTTPDNLKTTTLDKYLVMDADANVPNASFTFTVAPGTAVAADTTNGKLAVLAGVGTPSLKIGEGTAETDGNIDMTFVTTDTTTAEASTPTNDSPVFVTTGGGKTTDEKYVKKTLALDFSGVVFPEPGVYRYIIKEEGNNQGITNGYVNATTTETTRTLDVYVEHSGTVESGEEAGKPQLKIANYVMYSGTVTGAPNKEGSASATSPNNGAEVADATKSRSITNVYSSQDLTFGKIVTGNQGSRDKYFDFTVTISNAVPGTVYTVDITNADATSGTTVSTIEANQGKTNETTITVPAAAEGETKSSIATHFYLQNNQYITIKGLAKDTTYTVTENAEDYASTATGTEESSFTIGSVTFDDSTSGTIAGEDITTGFTNDRSGVVPTGIMLRVAAPSGIGLTAFGGIVYLAAKRRKDEEDEDEE